jgi:hypothetical protein
MGTRMEHNPYTPPQTNIEASIPREVAPRPVAVWLLVILLFVFTAVFALATARFVWVVFAHWDEVSNAGLMMFSLVWRLAIIAIFFATAYSAYRARRWTRWVGVALIVAFAAYGIFRADTTYYANDAERAGGQAARLVIMPLLLGWWAYALAFSAKARRYFSQQT